MQQALSFPAERRVLSVSDLASGLRALVETEYDDVWVEGELSGFKRHRSGHCYFTLKDDSAQIRCVLWRHFTRYVYFEPKDGMLVRLHGQMSVYEARGDMQLVTRSMQLAGEGALQAAFEALKRKLAAEGLFDEERKRDIPRLPSHIGVITSGSGAALHDILSILERRFPAVQVTVCPVAVQGMGASNEIARAIRRMNRLAESTPLDVLIVGRGGGSIEDLWAFNEENVARAIAASDVPIVSAVGHETDFTIADFVADFRAATPSMAAEIVVPDRREMAAGITQAMDRACNCLLEGVDRRRRRIDHLLATRAFHRPTDRMRQLAQRVDDLAGRLDRITVRCVGARQSTVNGLLGRLVLLDPNRPMSLGYARIELDGDLVSDAEALAAGDEVRIVFRDGRRSARITE